MAVASPPRPPTAPPPPSQRPPGRPARTAARSDGGWRADPTFHGTVALTALTLVVGLGCGRLFTAGRWLWPVVLSVVAAHAAAFWSRRRELQTAAGAVVTIASASVVAAWTVLGDTTYYGIPAGRTLRAALHELADARDAFQVVKAPTEVLPGFVLALVLALAIAAFMSDWAAFRLQTPVEALVPAFTLFVFTAALGGGRYRALVVASFVAAALAFVVVHGAAGRARTAWFGGKAARGPGLMARTAAAIGAVSVVAGLLLWPLLPGAGGNPLVKYKNTGPAGPSSRSTVSPLVDIRGRLVERSDIEVFTVASDARAYWRLTSLDTFNGTIWQSNTKYRTTNGPLGTAEPLVGDVPSARATQAFRVRALESIWLPAAYRPQRVQGIDGVSYNADTASLITDDATTDGYTYVVTSAVPDLSPELLATAPAQAPPDIASRYLRLPELPSTVVEEARRIVRRADATTPYAQARALQDHFRSGRFTYDLSVPPGHSRNALERFLFETRRGYCEQFAGAYAVLARAIGLPARVAVGFTPGELRSDELFHVQDRHAHAWPEVYLHGFGWVAFEPTPGRGAPGGEDYTGVPEAQEGATPGSPSTTSGSPATTVADDATPSTVPSDAARDLDDGGGSPDGGSGPSATRVWLTVALVGAALYLLGVPLGLHLAVRRTLRATTAAERVGAAWTRAVNALAQAGVRRRPSETVTEFAARAVHAAGLQADQAHALRGLGQDMAVTCYSGAEPTGEMVARAGAAADLVVHAVTDQLGTGERVRWWLDARRALRVLRTGTVS